MRRVSSRRKQLQARRALRLIRSSIAPAGRLVLNADDFALSDDGDVRRGPARVATSSGSAPTRPCCAATFSAAAMHAGSESGSITIREAQHTQAHCRSSRAALHAGGHDPVRRPERANRHGDRPLLRDFRRSNRRRLSDITKHGPSRCLAHSTSSTSVRRRSSWTVRCHLGSCGSRFELRQISALAGRSASLVQ